MTDITPRKVGRRGVVALAAGAVAAPALAQTAWPSGPIRFIGVFPPGASRPRIGHRCRGMTRAA